MFVTVMMCKTGIAAMRRRAVTIIVFMSGENDGKYVCSVQP
jgi:hypothetical protein